MANNWYWNKRLGEMAADFVGFQGTPAAFGNALKALALKGSDTFAFVRICGQ